MKAGFFSVAAVALLQLVAAQPHGARHMHHKRDAVVTQIDVVTVEAQEVVVYVDQKGQFIKASTFAASVAPPTTTTSPLSTTAASTTKSPSTTTTPAAVSTTTTPAPTTLVPTTKSTPPPPPPTTTAAPPPAASPSSAPVVAVQEPSHAGPGFGSAVAYSPYNEDQTCRSTAQVAQDLAGLSEYQVIRIYGTDCNQVSNVVNALAKGQQIIAGIFDITQVSSEVAAIVSAVNGNWGVINTVSVGNELVQDGTAPSAVIAAIGQARAALTAAGYKGPVVTVDTQDAMLANMELCAASDYCAINCHPFFDQNTAAPGSGAYVLGWVQRIQAQSQGKMVVVTETGWPHQGESHGLAVPSYANQAVALASLQSTFSSNMVLLSSYNNLWRPSQASTYYAEQYWGIHGNSPSGP